MDTVDSVETQKAAYGAVDGGQKIRERDIKELVSTYGKLLNKDSGIGSHAWLVY